jgi:K+-transporting ATPase ATPase C chain
MKKYILPSVKLTVIMIILVSVVYTGLVTLIGKAAPGKGNGVTLSSKGRVVGYELLGQKFTADNYFWGRPSAVDYNAAGSGGSNKGASNPDYLKIVQDRIDTFLAHHPGIKKEEIPSDLVTASGSGLDPHISPEAAYLQVKRIAAARGIAESTIKSLVDAHVEKPVPGPSKVNVLKLNIGLDDLK